LKRLILSNEMRLDSEPCDTTCLNALKYKKLHDGHVKRESTTAITIVRIAEISAVI